MCETSFKNFSWDWPPNTSFWVILESLVRKFILLEKSAKGLNNRDRKVTLTGLFFYSFQENFHPRKKNNYFVQPSLSITSPIYKLGLNSFCKKKTFLRKTFQSQLGWDCIWNHEGYIPQYYCNVESTLWFQLFFASTQQQSLLNTNQLLVC